MIKEVKIGKSEICENVLTGLPRWFGIESARNEYIRAVESLPMFTAEFGGQVVGFLSLEFHNEFTAEVHVMAVLEEHHGQGHGHALLEAAKNYALSRGAEYLMVKTLGPSRPNAEYDLTRRFYERAGFRPLQEIPAIWGKENPCLLMVQHL
jgi:GNAT superfamily N-acetyltransferase